MSKNKKNDNKKSGSILKWVIALFAEIVIFAIMIVGYWFYYLDSKLDKINNIEIDEEDLAINEGINNEVQQQYKTIAIFGIDARDVTNLGEGNRSDSIMIVNINNETKEVRIVSVYRDSYLEIENESPVTAKVNAAYAYGGPQLAIKTLNANLDLQITDFITVNFLGLTKAIDDLGGITVHVEEDELPVLNMAVAEQISVTGIYSDGVFTTGDLVLNGTQATAYARVRSTDQGDITRTERQRYVITKMFQKAKSSDLSTIDNIIDDVFPEIATSLTKDELKDLSKAIFDYQIVDTVGFPFSYTVMNHETKGSILIPADLSSNVSALHGYMFNETNYVPTANVQNINSIINGETGVTEQPITVMPQSFE